MSIRLEDMGIDPKTKTHRKILTAAENIFLGLLWTRHVGRENRVDGDVLAVLYAFALNGWELPACDTPKTIAQDMLSEKGSRAELDRWMRDVRMMQNHLLIRHDHCPVLSAAGVGGGYWIADTAGETAAFFESFRKRALTGFVKASRGRKAVAVDLAVQMMIEFDGLVADDPVDDGPKALAAVEQSTAASLAERVIERMLASPQRFAADLARLRDRFGAVLVPRTRADEIRAQAARLQELIEGI